MPAFPDGGLDHEVGLPSADHCVKVPGRRRLQHLHDQGPDLAARELREGLLKHLLRVALQGGLRRVGAVRRDDCTRAALDVRCPRALADLGLDGAHFALVVNVHADPAAAGRRRRGLVRLDQRLDVVVLDPVHPRADELVVLRGVDEFHEKRRVEVVLQHLQLLGRLSLMFQERLDRRHGLAHRVKHPQGFLGPGTVPDRVRHRNRLARGQQQEEQHPVYVLPCIQLHGSLR